MYTCNGLSFTCTLHLKTFIASTISDKIFSQNKAQANSLSIFSNSVKFSFRSWDN